MTKKYISEGNKIIAEFDGWKHSGKGGNLSNIYSKGDTEIHCDGFGYDTSWDWLMPVYKKLTDKLNERSETIKSDKSTTWVSKQAPLKHIDDCLSSIRCEMWGARIKDTFHGIVETIKLYNKKEWS